MPVLCPRCRTSLIRGALRCFACGADARAAIEPAELEVSLDLSGPDAKEEAARLLAEPGRTPEEVDVLRAVLDG